MLSTLGLLGEVLDGDQGLPVQLQPFRWRELESLSEQCQVNTVGFRALQGTLRPQGGRNPLLD